jgi:hypothetical protein
MLDDIRTTPHAQLPVSCGSIRVRVAWAAWRFSVVSQDGPRMDVSLEQPIAEAGRLG